MNFFSKLKEIFLYSLLIKEEDEKVIDQIQEENRKFAIKWTIAELGYWIYCLIMAFRNDLFIRCRIIYIIMLIICSVLLVALFFAKRVNWLIFLIKILLCISLLASGVFIAWILLQDDSMTIMLYASVLIAPILFINNTLTNVIMSVLNIILASILFKFGLSSETYGWAIPNLIIFSSIGVILAHFVNKSRFERFAYAESAVKLAELQAKYALYDQMTDLLNRRAFSDKLDQLQKNDNLNLTVIMVDINGLKKVNDTLGHEAGDEVITGTAKCIKESFKDFDNQYRLGGDEFCILIEQDDVNYEKDIKKLEELSKNWNGKFIKSISISYGIASSKEFSDINEIIKEADKRMYEFKNNYYKKTGQDRRRF